MQQSIVSTDWLQSHLDNPDLIILDATQEKNKQDIQIKGARYFDIKKVFSDTNSAYPNMLADAVQFEKGCRVLGINKSSQIVVYDNVGIYTSPRVWWMFKTMGHENVAVLNGGLPVWRKHNFETENVQSRIYKTGDFAANFNQKNVKDFEFVKGNISNPNALVIDARSAGRFNGTTPEPRAGLRGGHIPKSVNIPFMDLLDEEGKYKSKEDLQKVFNSVISDDKPLIFSCGSGITACVVLLASEGVLENEKAVYDGSWTEWAQRESGE
ncbi:MAG: thiosulfate/3-mercaptopyruvate sulfurtransferase [Saprospiraceae bacterium]|jgi:thiosulfate/3-mercaptopyruvate sulfurtransferase